MASEQSDNARYCADLVRAHDEDRWLAAHYAPPEARRKLLALYAFHAEVRRIPGAVSEPPLGEIRLQWQRDALQELRDGKRPRAHPVTGEIAEAGLHDASFEKDIAALLDAAARPLYGAPFPDIGELTNWLRLTEGAIDAMAARMFGAAKDVERAATDAGVAFALAREGAVHAPDFKQEIIECAGDEWRRATPALNTASAEIAPALLHLALTRAYLTRGAKPFPLVKRARLFAAMAAGKY